jgi:secreted Zn-dependent insulinase-like peptidase
MSSLSLSSLFSSLSPLSSLSHHHHYHRRHHHYHHHHLYHIIIIFITLSLSSSSGSILSVLKLKGWANGLGSFLSQSYADFACFGLSVELTDEGINHIDDVVSCCFSYIGMLLKAGPEEWILQEMKVPNLKTSYLVMMND